MVLGRRAWGARPNTGRVTKLTSPFGTCQVSVGPIGIGRILPSSRQGCALDASGWCLGLLTKHWQPFQSQPDVQSWPKEALRSEHQREEAAPETIPCSCKDCRAPIAWLPALPGRPYQGTLWAPGRLLLLCSATLAPAGVWSEFPQQDRTHRLTLFQVPEAGHGAQSKRTR